MAKAAPRSQSYSHPLYLEHLQACGGDAVRADRSLIVDIYARVSRATDDRYRSTEGQVHDCVAILLDQGFIPGMVFIDDSITAWNPTVLRPAWEAMMTRLEAGESSGIIVYNLTRFSRQPDDGSRLIKTAEHGLKVLDSDGTYDLTSPRGIRDFRNALTEAEYYSNQLRANVRRGKRTKARNGEFNVAFHIYGFDLIGGHHIPNEAEAHVLRTAAERILANEPQESVLRWMNTDPPIGVGQRTARGNPWSRKALREALTRMLNAGYVTHKGVVMKEYPDRQIFTPEERLELVEFYAGRRRGRPSAYLLVGVLRCTCGMKMYGRDTGTKGKSRIRYYCNPGRGEGDAAMGCGSSIDGLRTEAIVRDLAFDLLADTRQAAVIAAQQAEVEVKRAALQLRLDRAEQSLAGLDAKLAADEMEYNRYDKMTTPITKRIRDLRTELDLLHPSPSTEPSDPGLPRREWEARWRDAPLEGRRAILRQALRGRDVIVGRVDPELPRSVFDRRRISIAPLCIQGARQDGE